MRPFSFVLLTGVLYMVLLTAIIEVLNIHLPAGLVILDGMVAGALAGRYARGRWGK